MQDDLLMAFGQSVRRLRLSKGISQEEFADLCDLHRTYISDVELGKRNVSLENIKKMATALNISISGLFMEVENDASI
ncbi:MAG: helix-turn-helix transcriptional regulator [Clostridia bacterium]